MGEWKAPLSLRIRRDLRAELEEFAARERRTLGNIGELLLEWALEQLKSAGTTERLLRMPGELPVVQGGPTPVERASRRDSSKNTRCRFEKGT
jgi:hypothetical protein